MKTQWPLKQARALADELIGVLAPMCEDVCVAGSIRRQKPEVGDIEIIYIPRFEDRPVDMFKSELMSVADERIDMWLQNGTLAKRPSKVGITTWGPKNKLSVHVRSGIHVDFFATTKENWWIALVIRTGSKETNMRLANGAIARKRHLQAYGCGVTMPDGSTRTASSEEEVFELCGIPYLFPERR